MEVACITIHALIHGCSSEHCDLYCDCDCDCIDLAIAILVVLVVVAVVAIIATKSLAMSIAVAIAIAIAIAWHTIDFYLKACMHVSVHARSHLGSIPCRG